MLLGAELEPKGEPGVQCPARPPPPSPSASHAPGGCPLAQSGPQGPSECSTEESGWVFTSLCPHATLQTHS